MMTMGRILRDRLVKKKVLGVVYTAVGFALLMAAWWIWVKWYAHESTDLSDAQTT